MLIAILPVKGKIRVVTHFITIPMTRKVNSKVVISKLRFRHFILV